MAMVSIMHERESATEKISIIVPVFNDLDGLRCSLESLYALADDNYEILVSDDASEVDLRPACDPSRVKLIRLERNAGPGGARNEGAAHAVGTILAFIDADCTAPPDWLTRMRAAFRDPAVMAVAGTYAGVHVRGLASEVRFLEASYYHRKERMYVNAFVSANFAIRADVYRKVRGFPRIRIGEDLLLGYKLKHGGVEVLWLPDLCVGQYFRPTLGRYFRQQMSWSHGASTIAAFYPNTMALKWNVRRSVLQLQLGLQGVSIFGAVAGLLGAGWWVFGIAGTGCVALNIPFVLYIAQRKSLARTAQCLMVVLCLRNVAHLLGVSLSMATYPLMTLKSVAFGVRRWFGTAEQSPEPSWEHIGIDFPPSSDWNRLIGRL
jgi:GT2 family glycosyltransferase